MILEICTGSYDSVVAACLGGADRIELCSALDEGGITPSYGLMRESLALCRAKGVIMNVLIRPRGGDFLYSDSEVDMMVADIEMVEKLGADGVVIGALTAEGDIDCLACQRMIEAAGALSLTFHRAFDMCRNPEKALAQLCDMGIERVLTSGQQATAEIGISTLKGWVKQASGRISIMPGCGVNVENAARIISETGATELHASARSVIKSEMIYRRKGVEMGSAGRDEYMRKETNKALVQAIKAQIKNVK